MEKILYFIVRILLALVAILPIEVVACLGRFFGTLAYYLDARHRKAAILNLSKCFNLPEPEIKAIAFENFKRIGRTLFARQKPSQ
jgi:KDO2-lipid IV(A) lauroyltransferase